MPRRPSHTFSNQNILEPKILDPLISPVFDAPAFDALIASKGLRWIHEKGALCPCVEDLDSAIHDVNCTICENGRIFFSPVEIMGVFQGNRLEKMYEINGVWSIGEAVVTFTSYQNGPNGEISQGEMNDFQHGDKLTCLDYTFTWSELVEHNSTTGVDRLRYPAVTIEFLRDRERVYANGTDFAIDAVGSIKWLTPNRPRYNQLAGRGGIYTVVYTAQPVFNVVQIMRELRATQGLDRVTGEVTAVRLPQEVMIRRDFLFTHPADKIGDQNAPAARSGTTPPE